MITRERLEEIAKELPKVQPTNFLKMVNDSNAGIGFTLKLLLSAKDNRLSAGELSKSMGISTARVAVLIKKMENRNLILKKIDKSDARITLVMLSEKGKSLAIEMKENMLKHFANVIDKVGEENFCSLLRYQMKLKTLWERNACHIRFKKINGHKSVLFLSKYLTGLAKIKILFEIDEEKRLWNNENIQSRC